MMELYRAIVPANRIINDNHGQHYRIHQGNLQFLTNQFNEIAAGMKRCVEGEHHTVAPWNFHMPSLKEVQEFLKGKEFVSIRCEVWRCRNIRFDPQNYAKTFKAPLDLLVSKGYIEDDSWKFVEGITYCGGGESVYGKRAIRFKDDGLPDDMSPDEWMKWSDNYNDILIRILIS